MDDHSALNGAIRDLTDPMVVMRRLVDQALVLIPQAEGAVVELADDEFLTYVCTGGSLAEHVGTRLRVDASLSGLAVRTGETLHCDDADADPRVDREACHKVGAISMVCVPVRRNGQPVGALKVSASRPHAFSDDDVATLTRVAEFVTATIATAADMNRIASNLLAPSGVRSGDREFVANVLRPGTVMDVDTRRRINQMLAGPAFTMVCQPVIDLRSGNLAGAEALARFHVEPQQSPDIWFAEAQRVGLGVELELAAVKMALTLLPQLPDHAYLAVNVGPETALVADLAALFESAGAPRIVMGLTEHLQVEDYPHLRAVLSGIRASGTRVAIDDAGAGFAGLTHIVKLAPDIIKLDREIITGIDLDPVRRALASALVSFAAETGAKVVAEGIETVDELDTVRQLGVGYGQGYYLGRPGPVASLPQSVKAQLRAS